MHPQMIWYLPGFGSRVWFVDGDETQRKKIEKRLDRFNVALVIAHIAER